MKRARTLTLALGGAALLACVLAAGTPGAGADGWSKGELAALTSLQLSTLAPAPPDHSNAQARVPAAAMLGKRLFFDPRLSANGKVSCASCHDPAKQFQDDRALALGIGTTARRAMPLVETARGAWQFWDGRKDSLWSQALGPLEDPNEHGGNRLTYARLLGQHYRNEYEQVFAALPAFDALPAAAGPNGSAAERAAWRGMREEERVAVSRVFANMGKAIAAYEHKLRFGESRLDRYIGATLRAEPGAATLLTASEKRGLRLFVGRAECISCHNGPLLSDQHFHNTGVPPRDARAPDSGRAAAIAKVVGDEFNCLGKFSDAKPSQCQELAFIAADDPHMTGAFKTPSLRNVALRPPYMHAGQIATLDEVVRHYARAPAAALGRTERKPMALSEQDIGDIVQFLGAVSGPLIDPTP
ncbi:cytochrome-c peroxidase [Massilia glaciei]|uniref:Cytochrome-c peroxidase n=1 Tax=Massilia glaciei TaxID=1524097 RepID=A0A2U2I634_9BURK|nr:cytochrome c peroxidase [Massilia glaciei]PWF55227.1 cytochrome-c peroxidase [Massilia glaciei]